MQVIDEILSAVKDLDDIYTDEDGPALVFNCQSGKGRTTNAMAIAGLIIWHKKVRFEQETSGSLWPEAGNSHYKKIFMYKVNGSQLAKMKKSIPDMSLP